MKKSQPQLRWLLPVTCLAAVAALGLSVVVEFKYSNDPTHWIYICSLLTCFSLYGFSFFPASLRLKVLPYIKGILFFIFACFLLQTFLRVINVYDLGKYGVIQVLCQKESAVCLRADHLFYAVKVYRFITLSSLFFIKLLTYFGAVWIILQKPSSAGSSKKHRAQLSMTAQLFFLFLAVALYSQVEMVAAEIHFNMISTLQVLPLSFQDRFVVKMGGLSYDGWIQPYATFINKYTAPQSVILIPPQENTWAMVGNIPYLRWFTYPRTLVQVDPQGQVPPGVTTLLIAQGDCRYADCGWPKFTVSKTQIEKMILIDRKTLDETVIRDQDYQFTPTQERWGIIILKR